MVDLKAKPYYLNEEQIQWVEETIASMTDEEKVGQLFVNMVTDRSPEALKEVLDRYHVGAIRYHNESPEDLYEQNRVLRSKRRDSGSIRGCGGGCGFRRSSL